MSSIIRQLMICSALVLLESVAGAVTFDWVRIGNPGNAADVTGVGAVGYTYRISRFEVTNDQYVEFLNAVARTDSHGLYNDFMSTDARGGITQAGLIGNFSYSVKLNMGNKPANYVSFLDPMRFAKWLENGQPTGVSAPTSTEDGVYTIGTGIDTGLDETRAPGATFFLPSENEWYKAAYHQPAGRGGDSDDYWLYPTASNVNPTIATANDAIGPARGDISNPGTDVANFSLVADWNGKNGNVTTVGTAGANSASYYGTFDQGGNVIEWNEAVYFTDFRGARGGSYGNGLDDMAANNLGVNPGSTVARSNSRVHIHKPLLNRVFTSAEGRKGVV